MPQQVAEEDFDGLTAHCLRHTFRDRLRAVECPMDLIDQIGGWKSVSSIGNSYGLGYKQDHFDKWIQAVLLLSE
jgi:integrase